MKIRKYISTKIQDSTQSPPLTALAEWPDSNGNTSNWPRQSNESESGCQRKDRNPKTQDIEIQKYTNTLSNESMSNWPRQSSTFQ